MKQNRKKDYIEKRPLKETKLILSSSQSPAKEKILGKYNVYDNIIKLISIIPVEFKHDEIIWESWIPELGLYRFELPEQIQVFDHDCINTPFVETSLVDLQYASGFPFTEYGFYFTLTFNNRTVSVKFNAGGVGTATYDIEGTETPPENLPPANYKGNIYIYHLNTKRPLDK